MRSTEQEGAILPVQDDKEYGSTNEMLCEDGTVKKHWRARFLHLHCV